MKARDSPPVLYHSSYRLTKPVLGYVFVSPYPCVVSERCGRWSDIRVLPEMMDFMELSDLSKESSHRLLRVSAVARSF